MRKFVTLFLVLCALGIGVLGLILESTDVGAKEQSGDLSFAKNAKVVQASSLNIQTMCFRPDSPEGKAFLKKAAGRNEQIAYVDQDCWTIDEENLFTMGPEGEWYLFGPNDTLIWFVDKIKVPPEGLPFGFGIDQAFWPCVFVVNQAFRNINPSFLILDDIYWSPIEGSGIIEEWLMVWSVTRDTLTSVWGFDVQIDWAVGKEYQPLNCPDFDGDGNPDWFLEFAPIPPGYFYIWKEPDECGAWFINFLEGNSNAAIIVNAPFDNVPSLPPRPTLPGMAPGEDGETRPWCFFISSI
jgi:hypothetical protein